MTKTNALPAADSSRNPCARESSRSYPDKQPRYVLTLPPMSIDALLSLSNAVDGVHNEKPNKNISTAIVKQVDRLFDEWDKWRDAQYLKSAGHRKYMEKKARIEANKFRRGLR